MTEKTCPDCKGTNIAEIMYGYPSSKFLDEFLKYLEIKKHVDFASIENFLEIGPGRLKNQPRGVSKSCSAPPKTPRRVCIQRILKKDVI